jgi:uncharacterized membrane protein
MSFNKKISNFLNEAFTSQIIDETTKIKLQNFADKYENKSILSFLNIIILCGAIALNFGLILLVSHNWHTIANIVKFGTFIGLITSLYIVSYFLRNKNQKINQIIYFIISGLMIAGISLMLQIFQLTIKNGGIFLIWFLLILPMAIILKNSWIATLSAFGFYFGIIQNTEFRFFNIDQVIFLTIIFSSGILLPKTFKNLNEYFYQTKIICYILLGIMIYILGIIGEKNNVANVIKLDAITLFILVLNLMCLAINFKNNYKNKINLFKILQQSESIIFAIILAQFLKIYHPIFYWMLWFWGCFVIIYEGEISKKRGLINAGIWLFTLGIITRFFDLIYGIKFNASMLIIFGISLIILAIIAEKFRRKFINNIFKKYE